MHLTTANRPKRQKASEADIKPSLDRQIKGLNRTDLQKSNGTSASRKTESQQPDGASLPKAVVSKYLSNEH